MALWELCFGESSESSRFYFDAKYRDDRVVVERDASGVVISALQLIPYRMTFGGEMVDVSYVSSACTHPAWRGQGIMKRLLAEGLRRTRARGHALSILIPQETWLFDYYGRQGYLPVFDYQKTWEYSDGEDDPGLTAREAREEEMEAVFRYFDTWAAVRDRRVQHDREDFLMNVASVRENDGAVMVAVTDEGEIAGVAIAGMGVIWGMVKDHACDSPRARRAIVRALERRWEGEPQEWRDPAEDRARATHLGMARVTNAGVLLKAMAWMYAGEGMVIRLTDELLPENGGTFVLGDVSRGRGREVRMDAAELTAWLLGEDWGEPPQMSLMLE